MIIKLYLLTTFLVLGNVPTSPFEVEKSSLAIDGLEREYKLGSDVRQPVAQTETINASLDIKLAKNVKNPCPDSRANCSVIIEVIVYINGQPDKLVSWENKPASFEPGYTFSYTTGPVTIDEFVPLGNAEVNFRFLKNDKQFAIFSFLCKIKDSIVVVGD